MGGVFSASAGWRIAAVMFVAGLLCGCGDATPSDPLLELAARLSDRDVELRRAAAAQIAAIDGLPQSLVVPTLAAVNDDDLQVRLDAADALGRCDDPALLPEIARRAQTHRCSRTRQRLAAATEQIVERERRLTSPAPP